MTRFVLALSALVSVLAWVSPNAAGAQSDIAKLEKQIGGRIGVFVLGNSFDELSWHRADERFPMCSTFKFLLAAQILKRVDEGLEKLDRVVPYSAKDLLEYAPITKKAIANKGMTVRGLCAAAIQYSDNTAANLLLNSVGGPVGLTKFLRTGDDLVTRLDRFEPALNDPEKDLDTTTPRAMAVQLKRFVLGKALSESSRALLQHWLSGNTTGGRRLKAGLPADWKIADKTGTCGDGILGDVAILYPPRAAPLVVVTYVAGATVSNVKSENAIAEIARRIVSKAKSNL